MISPLNALLDDQLATVFELGIAACKLDASSFKGISSLAGNELVFSNPRCSRGSYVIISIVTGLTVSRMLNGNCKRLGAEVFSIDREIQKGEHFLSRAMSDVPRPYPRYIW